MELFWSGLTIAIVVTTAIKCKGTMVLTCCSYIKEYIDLERCLNRWQEETNTLKVQIDIWDAAREICLDVSDEMNKMQKYKGGENNET